MTAAAMASYVYVQIDQARTELKAVSEWTTPPSVSKSVWPSGWNR
jgi:hypothetical protein